MSKQAVKVTLNRAHKVAERIGAKVTEFSVAASGAAAQVSLNGISPEKTSNLKLSAGRVHDALAQMRQFLAAQVVVRNAIGRANAEVGVTTKLAEIEGNKLEMKALDSVLRQKATGAALTLDMLANYKPLGTDNSYGLEVAVLADTDVQELQKRRDELERLNFALSDQLADINGSFISFELDAELVAQLGLA